MRIAPDILLRRMRVLDRTTYDRVPRCGVERVIRLVGALLAEINDELVAAPQPDMAPTRSRP